MTHFRQSPRRRLQPFRSHLGLEGVLRDTAGAHVRRRVRVHPRASLGPCLFQSWGEGGDVSQLEPRPHLSCSSPYPDREAEAQACPLWTSLGFQAAASATPGAQVQPLPLCREALSFQDRGSPAAAPASDLARALWSDSQAPAALPALPWGCLPRAPRSPAPEGGEAQGEALPPPALPHSSIVRSAPSDGFCPEAWTWPPVPSLTPAWLAAPSA